MKRRTCDSRTAQAERAAKRTPRRSSTARARRSLCRERTHRAGRIAKSAMESKRKEAIPVFDHYSRALECYLPIATHRPPTALRSQDRACQITPRRRRLATTSTAGPALPSAQVDVSGICCENARACQASEALFCSDEPMGLEAVLTMIRSMLRSHAAAAA